MCNQVRKNLVVVGEEDEDAPSLSGVGREIVAGLRDRVRHVKHAQALDPEDLGTEKRLMALGNTAAKVLEAARKLQVDGIAAVENMSFAERAKLFMSWYMDLPAEYRAELQIKMGELEGRVAQPVQDDQHTN